MTLGAAADAPRAWGRAALFLAAAFLGSLASLRGLWLPMVDATFGDARLQVAPIYGLGISGPTLTALIWAFLTDRVPRTGPRREGYLLFAGLLGTGAWSAAPFIAGTIHPWLTITLTLSLAAVVRAAAVRGALVEIGQSLTATGRLAAGLVVAEGAGSLAQVPLLGALAARPPAWTAGAGAALSLATILAVILSLARRQRSPVLVPVRPAAPPRLRDYLRSRPFWALILVGLCATMGTDLPELQLQMGSRLTGLPDEARLTGTFPTAVAFTLAAASYFLLCRRFPPRLLLPGSLVIAALGTLSLLASSNGTSPTFALATIARSFGAGLTTVAMCDLAMRAAPSGHESLAFALTAFAPPVITKALTIPIVLATSVPLPRLAFLAAGALLVAILAARLIPARLLETADGETGWPQAPLGSPATIASAIER